MKKAFFPFILVFICLLTASNKPFFAQDTLNVNQTFNQDSLIDIAYNNPFYGLSVSGSSTLNSDFSLARIILVDSVGNEHLLYEITSQLEPILSATFVNVGEETSYMDETNFDKLRIEIIDGSITVNSLHFLTQPDSNANILKTQHRQQVLNDKLSKIQAYVDDNELPWFAGITSISLMTHEEKTLFFGEKYDRAGFDFFDGGIFCDITAKTVNEPISDMIESFDWRTKHDANDPGSSYFDDNPDGEFGDATQSDYIAQQVGNGWMTGLRCYHCPGWCWLTAGINQLEAYANIYFNQHLDVIIGLDLSEQQVLTDTYVYDSTDLFGYGGNFIKVYSVAANPGIVPDSCFEWEATPFPNNTMCPAPRYTLNIGNYQNILDTDPQYYDEIKKDILTRGPLGIGISGHAMCLVGWGKIYVGQSISRNGNGTTDVITIPPNSPYVGNTYWICQQTGWHGDGGDGYVAFVASEVNITGDNTWLRSIVSYSYIEEPSITSSLFNVERQILDMDGDGIYNWGIGEKPTGFSDGPNLLDGNDNNSALGAMHESGGLSFTLPYFCSFEPNMLNWNSDDSDFAGYVSLGGSTLMYPPAATDGTWFYTFPIESNNLLGEEAILETPFFSLLNYCETYLSFDYWFN